jgi:large subunit ribosomal protein L17
MNHRKAGKTFGRKSDQRKAMFISLAISLIEHGSIRTTLPRAKELRRFIEPMITRAKNNTLANRRLLLARLRSKDACNRLLHVLGPHFLNRPGGYSRVLKDGFRAGDCAPMAVIQWMDRNKIEAVSAPEK